METYEDEDVEDEGFADTAAAAELAALEDQLERDTGSRPIRAVNLIRELQASKEGAGAAEAPYAVLVGAMGRANIAMALCGMASYFAGSAGSAFTAVALEERQAIFGHPAQTAAEMVGGGALVAVMVPWPVEQAQTRWAPLPLPSPPPRFVQVDVKLPE